MKIERKYEAYLNITLTVLIMLFATYVGTTLGKKLKIDTTQERLYSLSEGTKSIIKKLNTPMTLKLYYSKTAANKGTEGIRAFNNYYFYVKDLLDEYVANSRNNLKLEVIDPRPDTKEEEDAIAAGLKRFPLSETEKYFFGLVVRSESGSEKVIEFFDPNMQENVEYDVTKLIYQATGQKKITVGILSSLKVLNEEMSPYIAQMMKMQGKDGQESWIITKMMQDFYTVVEVAKDSDKISAVDLLVIIHPKNLEQKTLLAIDQYLMEGGKILLLVDPLAVIEQAINPPQMGGPPPDYSSDLAPLLDSWGIKYDKTDFAGDRYLSGVRRIDQFSPPVRLLPILDCNKVCTSVGKDIMANGINALGFIYPGILSLKSNIAERVYTPLVGTSEKGNSYKAMGYELGNPVALMNKFQDGTVPVMVGYKIVGKFKSAFTTGIMESKKESAVVVLADVDFIHDQNAFRSNMFGVSLANDNSKLFLNALENLSGNNDLMSIRSKGKFSRNFDVVDEIELSAQKDTEAKVVEINGQIEKFTQELNQLGRSGGNVAIIQNEGIKKKKELALKIALLKGELREVKRIGRERVENLGVVLQNINTMLVPIIILIVGIFFSFRGKRKIKTGV